MRLPKILLQTRQVDRFEHASSLSNSDLSCSWYERAREKAWKKFGGRFYTPSQTKRVYPAKGLLGYKVLIDGYNNEFEVPAEQLRSLRSSQGFRYVGFSNEEREKIAQMKAYVKDYAMDDRARNKHIIAARRQPTYVSQASSESRKPTTTLIDGSFSSADFSTHDWKPFLSPRSVQRPLPKIESKSSAMTSADAYTIAASRLAADAEQRQAIKRRELMAQVEESVEHGILPPIRRTDVTIPLPDHPSPRSSRLIKSRLDVDLRQATVKPYERYASATARSTAVACLEEAGYFKRKSWLKQVEISKEMVKHRVQRRMRRADASQLRTPHINVLRAR